MASDGPSTQGQECASGSRPQHSKGRGKDDGNEPEGSLDEGTVASPCVSKTPSTPTKAEATPSTAKKPKSGKKAVSQSVATTSPSTDALKNVTAGLAAITHAVIKATHDHNSSAAVGIAAGTMAAAMAAAIASTGTPQDANEAAATAAAISGEIVSAVSTFGTHRDLCESLSANAVARKCTFASALCQDPAFVDGEGKLSQEYRQHVLEIIASKDLFYIGIASGRNYVEALKNRYKDYKICHGINHMLVVYESDSQDMTRVLEGLLVDHFKQSGRCINRAAGGGGNKSKAAKFFVYVAYKS